MLGFLLKFQYSKHPEGKEKVSLQTPLHSSGPAQQMRYHQQAYCGKGSLAPKRAGVARQSLVPSNRAGSSCPMFQLNISVVFIMCFVVGA